MLGNYDFTEILESTYKVLKDGSPVVFYCTYLEPLTLCVAKMKQLGFLNIKLYDAWTREYQVLKQRTHPLMYMDSHPGYILSAIKV